MSLQDVLLQTNNNYSNITSLIPTQVNFDDQPDYFSITTTDFNDYPEAYVVTVQSDSKILVAGYSGLYNNDNDAYYNVIKRFNSNGTVDETFTSPYFNNEIYAIQEQSDGKLIVVGNFNFAGSSFPLSNMNFIVRLNSDGSIDESFNSGSGLDGAVYACKVLANDSIIISGNFSSYNGTGSLLLAKLSSAGDLDTTFAGNIPTFPQIIYAIEEDANNNIYVAGNFSSVYKLDATGVQDMTFGTGDGFNNQVTSLKIDSNGKLVVGGFFNQYQNSDCNTGVVRLLTNGDLDTSFAFTGAGLYTPYGYYYGSVSSIAIQNDGKIVAGGYFSNYNSGTDMSPTWSRAKGVIRFGTDGTVDSTFDTGKGFDGYVNSVAIDSSNYIYCAGYFNSYNGKMATSNFNFSNEQIAGCCAKLSPTGQLVGTSLKQNINALGIDDGGNDIWDGGLFFNTNINQSYNSITPGNSIPFTHSSLSPALDDYIATFDAGYTIAEDYGFDQTNYDFPPKDGAIVLSDSYFGTGSSYFTQMYPGLFVLAAHGCNIDEFSITGGTGVDGSGEYADGSIDINVSGNPYAVFYKTNYNTGELGIVKMIIVPGVADGITQQIVDPTENDDQILTGLNGRSELYVLTFTRFDGQNTDESLLTSIATAFLSPFVVKNNFTTCAAQTCQVPAFKCYLSQTSSCTCATWKTFYPNCSKSQQALGVCSGSGAYVPAITVCNQRLL